MILIVSQKMSGPSRKEKATIAKGISQTTTKEGIERLSSILIQRKGNPMPARGKRKKPSITMSSNERENNQKKSAMKKRTT